MSWDGYRDSLISSGHISEAALCGIQDGAAWTTSPTLNIQPHEVKALVAGLSNSATISANGITLGGQKYFYLQSDASTIQAKKGACGCSIAKSNTCLVIGIYKEGMQPGNARAAVEKIKEHLMTHSY